MSRVACLLSMIGALAGAAACDRTPPQPQLAFAETLDLAEHRGTGAAPRFDEQTGEIVQSPNSWIRWHFLLPVNARLTGVMRVRASSDADLSKTEVTVFVTDASTKWEPVFRAPLSPGSEAVLDVDLARWGGRMVRITTALPGSKRGGDDWTVSWKHLGIYRPSPAGSGVGPDARPIAPRRYNVLVVLFDTLRADHTQPYGSRNVKTPAMLELAATGTTFTNASSNASWTAPSVASLLTSTYPTVHGVAGGGGIEKLREVSTVPPELPFLPAILKQHGYATVAILNNPIIHPAFGFGRGFDEVHEYYELREQVLAEAPTPSAQVDLVWGRFIEPVLARDGDQPFFVYLHEIDPHSPYDAPSSWVEMYLREGGAHRDFGGLRIHTRFRNNPEMLRPDLAAEMKGLYNAEVSFMDAYLGELMARLEAAGHRDDTLVIFLSDHGESLTEHERLGHGDTLYEEVLRVPLVFSLPGVVPAGVRVSAAAELVDVAPTALEILGIPLPDDLQGRSLLPLLADAAKPQRRPTYAQAHFEDKWTLDSVRLGRWKLIMHSSGNHRSYELYDLSTDPHEAENRWSEESVIGQTLRQLLAQKIRDDGRRRTSGQARVHLDEVDESIRKNLEELGYLE